MADIVPIADPTRKQIHDILVSMHGIASEQRRLIDLVEGVEGTEWVQAAISGIPTDDLSSQLDSIIRKIEVSAKEIVHVPPTIPSIPSKPTAPAVPKEWHEYSVTYRLAGEYIRKKGGVSRPVIVLEGVFTFTSQTENLAFVPSHILQTLDNELREAAQKFWYSDHASGLSFKGNWSWEPDTLEGGAGDPTFTGSTYTQMQPVILQRSDMHWERKVGAVRFASPGAQHFRMSRSDITPNAPFKAFVSWGKNKTKEVDPIRKPKSFEERAEFFSE
jgi:hypothetical protein